MRFIYGLTIGLVTGPILWANRRALIGYAAQGARWALRRIADADPEQSTKT